MADLFQTGFKYDESAPLSQPPNPVIGFFKSMFTSRSEPQPSQTFNFQPAREQDY